MISYTKLHFYNLDTKVATAIEPPAEFSGLQSYYDVVWQDDNTVALQYVKYGQSASMLKKEVVLMNVSSKMLTVMNSLADSYMSSMKFVGDSAYVVDSVTREVETTSLKQDQPLAAISGSAGTGTFLLKTNDAGTTAINIYSLDGEAGHENSFKLNVFPASGGQKSALFSPPGYSNYMLGWGKDYDEIIYANLGSMMALKMYTISTNKSETLISDLPLTL